VDRFGPGAHADMDIRHFRRSAAALGPFFERMVAEAETGGSASHLTGYAPRNLAGALRRLGVEAEAAMLAASDGVNTHKGAIWTLGLLCAAAGMLHSSSMSAIAGVSPLGAEAVCDKAAGLARDIVSLTAPGLVRHGTLTAATHGETARLEHGLRSARDEAMEGFPAIRASALPLARRLRESDLADDERVITVLLAVMSRADDTCIVARGGIRALYRARASARQILDSGGPFSLAGSPIYSMMVAEFNASGLSPGGSADLCAASLFLADLEAAYPGEGGLLQEPSELLA
ncbi:MAG: hypothetical protein CVV51_12420, partial [Spirochaetae bacterium HGW-Spirochaetae-7]